MNQMDSAADRKRRITAFVLCGGLGTRLRPVVSDRPKSMALVGGVPFLQLLLERVRSQEVDQVILGTGYMAEQIEAFFRRGQDLALRISYSREREPLGTGGALKLAEPILSDPILVLNGDSFVEWSLTAILELFTKRAAAAVIVLQAVPDVARYGSVTIDADGRVTEFVEKGTRTGAGLINAGVYLLRKEMVSALPAGRAISLEKEVFPQQLNGKVYGLVSNGLFIDIGIPADLERARTVLGPRLVQAGGER
jgi:D-glycero-alpha-D-manno-heptose 1-phosphate guanylyltransferase